MKNKYRIMISSVFSAILVFYSFNFIPRNVSIIASRSLGRQIIDYILNFVLFTVVIYLALSLISFILKKLRSI